MEISGMLFLAVLVIAFFVFLYAIIKTARGWGGVQTAALSVLVLSSLLFLVFSAVVMDRRLTEFREYDKAVKLNEKLEADAYRAQFGDPERPPPEDGALVPLLRKFDRMMVDRLRVWRGLQKTNVVPGGSGVESVELKLVNRGAEQQPPGDEPVTPSTTPSSTTMEPVPQRIIVYLFGEVSTQVDDRPQFMPRHYLGEYSVEESQADVVKLVPTMTVSKRQVEMLEDVNRCALYELMPVDAHDVFADPDTVSDDEIFGHMDPDKIGQYLGLPANLRKLDATEFEDDEQRQMHAIWRTYVLDGKPAPEGTPADSLWIRVEFLQEYKVGVDAQTREALDGGFFDTTGRSIDLRLMRGEEETEVTVHPGEQRVLQKDSADQLIRDGIAKLIQPIFVRPLNNYRLAFHNIYNENVDLDSRIDLVTRENATVNATINTSRELISRRQVESSQLEKDLGQHEKELQVVQATVQRLTTEVAAIRKQLVDLMESNHRLHQQLVDTQLTVARALGNSAGE